MIVATRWTDYHGPEWETLASTGWVTAYVVGGRALMIRESAP